MTPKVERSRALSRFWLIVYVAFPEPIPVEGDPSQTEVVGYFQNLGVSAESKEAAQQLAEEIIDDGAIDWKESEYRTVDLASLDTSIRSLMSDPARRGVWYRSGRVLV